MSAVIYANGNLMQDGEIIELTIQPNTGRQAINYVGDSVTRGIRARSDRKPTVTLGFLVRDYAAATRAISIAQSGRFYLEEDLPQLYLILEATSDPIARMIPVAGRPAIFRVDITAAEQ